MSCTPMRLGDGHLSCGWLSHAFLAIEWFAALEASWAVECPEWKIGQRVGVGFFGGEDGVCEPCRREMRESPRTP